jgi:hypothetical protein
MIYKYYIACKKYYDLKNIEFEHWFLFKKDLSAISRNLLTKIFLNTFSEEIGKKISTTIIRKITTSSLIDIEKFRKLAMIQGHSLGTALSSYSKF